MDMSHEDQKLNHGSKSMMNSFYLIQILYWNFPDESKESESESDSDDGFRPYGSDVKPYHISWATAEVTIRMIAQSVYLCIFFV